ncbi:NADH oxidase [candidate division KSB1 bacterium]|nr:MAG: NADH oxidase [candidate division KSB1 bacterium]
MSSSLTYVVIGGNAAGMSAARRIRRNDAQAKVVVLEKTDTVSYGACGIPYYVADIIKNKSDLIALPLQKFLDDGIDVRLQHEAVEIDVRKRTVAFRGQASDEIQKISYDRLILSLGARPVVPKLPGIELSGVFTVRSLNGAEKLKQELQSGKHKKAVIIGGGSIGLEMAEALRTYDVQVTIVELLPHVLPIMDFEMAELVEDELKQNGCQVKTGQEVVKILGASGVTGVALAGGEQIDASLVLVAVGVRPNAELAAKAGIQLGATGAIQVDGHMRTNVRHVYAAGDCAEVKNLVTNKNEFIPLGNTANKQGRIAGDNASGGHSFLNGVVGNTAVKVFGLDVARAGITEAYANRLKMPVKSVKIKSRTEAHYMPGSKPIHIKLVFDVNSGRLLGAQMAGGENVAKRMDILAAAIQQKMTVMDVAQLDLNYAPPFAPVWEPILIAANQAVKLVRK